ncbi:hypothetical protein JZ785_25700 [Alicyclobacillus curvatus]|nr:hypothetical protein JZ785_25700 [Alicyclobacillus curvatus]
MEQGLRQVIELLLSNELGKLFIDLVHHFPECVLTADPRRRMGLQKLTVEHRASKADRPKNQPEHIDAREIT